MFLSRNWVNIFSLSSFDLSRLRSFLFLKDSETLIKPIKIVRVVPSSKIKIEFLRGNSFLLNLAVHYLKKIKIEFRCQILFNLQFFLSLQDNSVEA
jgi:hypothetical protein